MRNSRLLIRCLSSQHRSIHTSLPLQHSDAHLRAVFDDAQLWAAICRAKTFSRPRKGLFGYEGLHQPSDLDALADRICKKAQLLVRRLTSADSDHVSPQKALLQTAKQFDRLSDTLCSVIDMAEAIRQVHPEPAWLTMADDVYNRVCGFMNVLNADVRLYERLRRVAEPFLPLSPETKQNVPLFSSLTIANQLLADFQRSGITLPAEERRSVVQLNDAIMQLSRRFTRSLNDQARSSGRGSTTLAELEEGLDDSEKRAMRRLIPTRWGRLTLEPGSWQVQALYREHPNDKVRQKLFRLAYPSSSSTVALLEELLWARQNLAKLVGSGSYAEATLKEKMAGSPESVMSFLRALRDANRPLAEAEVRQLSKIKALQLGIAPGDPLARVHAWDSHFLLDRQVQLEYANVPSPDRLSPFFSVGTVIQGLSRLFTRLYGISFQIEEAADETTWNPSVRKLAVMDEVEGRIGTIYADLFHTEGKDPHPAHYTVRCARRLDDDEAEGDLHFASGPPSSYEGLELQGSTSSVKPGRHQLPLIVLSCGFRQSQGQRPSLMDFENVMTVFHECGHAIHSMIGRTDFHEVAGTRCATDFVELPSVLMESFATSPQVLGMFARHYETDAPLPIQQLDRFREAQTVGNKLHDSEQITMAAVDQAYHAELSADFSSTETFYNVAKEFAVIPPVPGVALQSRFTHLSNYAASYYSYLFDRAIAGEIWRRIFAANPLDRQAGERYKQAVLRHGSSRDPWECIGDLLQDDRVARGGPEAMELVGAWGTTGDQANM